MAAMWWLATIVLFLLLITCIVFVIYALKTAIQTDDAINVDPLPRLENPDSEDKK
ncbi:hypothetical protein [Metabacillus idriensis]|uniref:hypothetical protein n=1 Tax=Metabacillus idriensis TaxID=324768 RepID=UPI003D280278